MSNSAHKATGSLHHQLPLFDPTPVNETTAGGALKQGRSGTFVDNMKLPVHRWYRYSAGFSAQWAEEVLLNFGLDETNLVLDPFVGSGTLALAASRVGIPSLGIEAHPFVARIAQAKLKWDTPVAAFLDKADAVLRDAHLENGTIEPYPNLIRRCFSDAALLRLQNLKNAWLRHQDGSAASELVWLAITAILRTTSSAGTAQWQYILPNKSKRLVSEPFEAFELQVQYMQSDMMSLQGSIKHPQATIIRGDARSCPQVTNSSVDAVVTSPPYANNYDYADATRFEMSFWGEVQRWSDLHGAVRRHLIVSSSQHASIEKLTPDMILNTEELRTIRIELSDVCTQLAGERQSHGGKKHYHAMIAAYFLDMARTWIELRRVCRQGAKVCFVIGDSAPYGVHVPVDDWLGRLAVAAGFTNYRFEKLRDRNTKWKNRKHRVPLHEGTLWVTG